VHDAVVPPPAFFYICRLPFPIRSSDNSLLHALGRQRLKDEIMVRLTGAALGFFAFAITILLGMATGNPIETTLQRAIQAMFVFFALGLCVGSVACRVIDEHSLSRYRELFPDGKQEGTTAKSADADPNSPVLEQ
jgi:hypothetical protein